MNSKVKPKLTFRYEEHLYESVTVGVIIIPKQKRPFYLANPYGRLKSNVVYVRRGSSTDETEPVETIAMANEDSGRGDLKVELSLLTPENENLPSSFAHTYFQLTEELPDFERPRKSRGPFDPPDFVGLDRDNRDFWREYAEYMRVNNALIPIRFVLTNRSGVQLSNSKLEVTVEALDAQPVQMTPDRNLPDEPQPTWSITSLQSVQEVLAKKEGNLMVDESDRAPVCHIRLGTLLPGEQARTEMLAIIPQAPGRLRLHLRILGRELATPIEEEHLIETVGEVHSLDFKGFKQLFLVEIAQHK